MFPILDNQAKIWYDKDNIIQARGDCMPEGKGQVHVVESEHYVKEKPKDIRGILEAVIVVLILLLVVAVVIPTTRSFLVKERGILALKEAKAVSMAVRNANYEYEVKGESIVSKNQESGLSDDALKNVMELSGAEGTLEHVKFDETNAQVLKLRYRKGDILVTYERPKKDTHKGWNVYQLKNVISDKE